MANCSDESSISFSDFPEDVQVCILSCLSPSDVSSFACTSKRFDAMCRNGCGSRLWYAMCDRRWGAKTQIKKWGGGKMDFKSVFKVLSEYENLIGFWRRSGGISGGISGEVAPLVFFEWGESCVVGSRVAPSKEGCSYDVIKTPFIWLSLSGNGQHLNYLKTNDSGSDSIRVNVSFMGKNHLVLEENNGGGSPNRGSPNGKDSSNVNWNFENVSVGSPEGSPPDRMMLEMYQHFANRMSPGASGERAFRRQRRREKERQGRRRWEPEHLVKIVHCSPTPSRPLQGLWKGISDDSSLDFYLVAYDDIGGVSCRRVGDSLKPFSGYAPVFWTSNATFVDSPLSHEEDYLYHTRMHIQPSDIAEDDFIICSPSRIMYINSSYELVIPDLAGTSNPRHVEGRVWQYVDGTFGYGFLRNNYIVDLKHIAKDGHVLDTAELCSG